jgi:hypothetical protein
MKSLFKTALAAAAMALGLLACGGGGDGGISGTGVTNMGTMSLAMTDAPACGYNHVYVTVEKVRVNKDSNAVDTDAGWSDLVLSPAKRVDLLTLTNGVLEELGQTTLPAGKYSQMRLVLATNGGTTPFANSVVPTGGPETALTTPSGQQSGLKLKVDMDIASDQVSRFVIDFDACKSIVQRGNSGNYNLKPVISVIPVPSSTGQRVIGYVAPAIALSSTNISLQSNGVPIKATKPDGTGRFELFPVPQGNYTLVVSAAGRVTAVMTGVPVDTSTVTTLNSTAVPILPAATATTSVTGTVTPTSATVRALQTLTGGPTIETVWAVVNAGSGAFTAVVPNGAPVKTAYVANPVSLNFAPDTAAADLYTFEAASDGVVKTQNINTAGAVPGIVFSFP